MSDLLDTVGRYAFSVTGLEITVTVIQLVKVRTGPWIPSRAWIHGYRDFFGQNFNVFLRKIYDF